MTEFTDEQRSDGNTAINAKLWAICQAEAKLGLSGSELINS